MNTVSREYDVLALVFGIRLQLSEVLHMNKGVIF